MTELTNPVNSADEFGTDLSSTGKERNSIPLLWQQRLSSTSPNSSFSAAVKAETTTSIPARCNKLMSSGSQFQSQRDADEQRYPALPRRA